MADEGASVIDTRPTAASLGDPEQAAPSSPRRRSPVRLLVPAVVAVVTAAAFLLFTSYQARRAFIGDQTICTVTEQSLGYDESLSPVLGTLYGGGDHPLGPSVGDEYVGHSGCYPFETVCTRFIEPLGTRLEC